MFHSRSFAAAFAFASVGFLAAPAGASQTTNQMQWQARSAARDAKTEVTDSWLTARTKITLYADKRVKGGQVGVETLNGTVRLYGKVDSQEARTAAASIAGSIEHVKAVKNDLQVVAPRDRKTTDTSDQEITRLVESRLATTAQLTAVAVRTDDGVVILTGTAASIGASARASELARDVPGVRAVKNELTF